MLYMYACYFLVVLFHLMIDCMLMLASLRLFCLQWVTSSMSQLAALIAHRFQCSIVVHTIHGK